MPEDERDFAHAGSESCSFRADASRNPPSSARYTTSPNVFTAEEMPFEHSPDGLFKHLVHEKLNTRECCIEAYMQFLEAAAAPASIATCGKKSSSSPKARATIFTGI